MGNKTIVALATAPGVAGLAVIRISGENSLLIADRIFIGKGKISDSKSHKIHYGKIYNNERIIDTVTISVFLNPHSFTGEDVIEIGCHGGLLVANELVNLIIENGATHAEPGEFTKRAFLNGKLDLSQVEAVADIIHSVSIPGVQTAARQLDGQFTKRLSDLRLKLLDTAGLLELELDFAEEGYHFIDKDIIKQKLNDTKRFCNELIDSYQTAEIMRSGYFISIVGYPNSGKSTLFNALLGRKRAIVSEIAGTTRDYLEEFLYINGLAIKIIDTAGIRETTDIIEIEGIRLVETVLQQSNMIMVLNDASISFDFSNKLFESLSNKYSSAKVVLIQNKIDLLMDEAVVGDLSLSATEGKGVDELKQLLYQNASTSFDRVNDILLNSRQKKLLTEACLSIDYAIQGLELQYENELISIDIRNATKILGELTGESWNEEVLNHIFSQFCIGK